MTDAVAFPLTLDNCASEPIHVPGHIQPHGAMLAFDHDGVLRYRSANAQVMLGNGLPVLGEIWTSAHGQDYEGLDDLIATVRKGDEGDVIPHAMQIQHAGGTFEVIAHRTSNGLICEFEQSTGCVPMLANFSFIAHRATEKLKREKTVDGLLKVAVEEVRRMTGFDRVMAYRFRHDDSGDVVAESVTAALDPFIGRRYPASDIPAQARRLYVINTLRLIANVGAQPVPIDAADNTSEPLDMSYGVLRSVSPVHIEYLGNMGVAASMSVSIVIGGKLWGMLACHHMTPRRLAYTVRMACDMLAQILASNLQGALAQDYARSVDAAASLRSRVIEQVLHANDVILALSAEVNPLLQAFSAHGLVLADGAKLETFGGMPNSVGTALVQWLNEGGHPPGRMVNMNSVHQLPPALLAQMDVWCGLLALPFGTETPSWVVLLRKEQIETVMWGGQPEKEYSIGPLGPRLTPRGSFDLWREIVRGSAVPWDEADLDSARKLLDELVRADAAHQVEISRARSHLLAMLGHDLRDPLQSISNTATLLEKGGGDGKISKRLHSSSSRMQRLVGQVMDMSHLHSGGLTFDLQKVDLVGIIEHLIAETRSAHPGLEITPLLPEHLIAEADGDRIGQVLSNLLSNASHHGTSGEPVLVQLVESDGQVKIIVSNSGQAIAGELATTLFRPFKRIGIKSATNRNGLGLGLYIAHQVMQGHKGHLTYSYAEPHVVFTAAFPVVQQAR